jgi:glycosyltransferase involved in cell wall biosynthesis
MNSGPARLTVLINGLRLDEGPRHSLTGNYYHLEAMARAMVELDAIRLRVLCDEYTRDPLAAALGEGHLVCRPLKGGGVLAADAVVARAVRELGPDVYHRPNGQLPFQRLPCRKVATISDLNFTVVPMPLAKRLYKEVSFRWTVLKADYITCISRFTAESIPRWTRLKPRHLEAIPSGVNPMPPGDDGLLPEGGEPWWITFAHQAHKNVEACLRALATDSGLGRLLVVGDSPWVEAVLKPLAGQLGVEARVRFLGRVSRPQLASLYRHAHGLLFMSRYEGFGLPILEAMSQDCPVICSNCGSLPEVAGDAAVVLGPDDVPGLAAAMRRLLTEPAFRSEFQSRGRHHCRRFTWNECARRTIGVYRQVTLGDRKPTDGLAR